MLPQMMPLSWLIVFSVFIVFLLSSLVYVSFFNLDTNKRLFLLKVSSLSMSW